MSDIQQQILIKQVNLNILYMNFESIQNQNQSTEDDEEVFVSNCNGSEQDLQFDQMVGALQDIVIEPNFYQLQQIFMRTHCMQFQAKEENKMSYMPIFTQYQTEVQKYILERMTQMIPGFSMQKFSDLLSSRTDCLDEELLEMINSFTNFQIFKQLMLQHRKYYEEQQKFSGLCIKGIVVNKQK